MSEVNDERLKIFLAQKKKERKLTCHFCGFESVRYQRSIDLNCGVGDFKPVVVCPFCYYSQRLEMVVERDAGFLIKLPQLSQAQLNMIIHSVYARSIIEDDNKLQLYDTLLIKLKKHRWDMHSVGPGADSAEVTAVSLSALSDEEYKNRGVALSSVRFWPDAEKMKEEFDYWRNSLYPKINMLLPKI
ncbi:hypothetical protein [Aeromonas hydrophila]|uniref:hypothetical protein n=1 Tax=Aeromonas hydrophila TaxID=644 RepID=UPI002B481FA3|nr:hypothetical protein [Aeromonas hydrophila]